MMKKTITTIILIFVFQTINAQIQIGPKLGVTGYQVISGGSDALGVGIYAGGFFDYSLNAKTNLQLDIAYVEKGSEEGKNINTFNYLEFSSKFKFFTNNKENNTGFYVSSGLGFNLLLDGKVEKENFIIPKEDLNSFDFSLQLSIGYKTNKNLSIDFKLIDVSLTTTDFEFVDNNNNTLQFNLRNIGANFTLAYGFDL